MFEPWPDRIGDLPRSETALVGFYDLTGFIHLAEQMDEVEVLTLMGGYFALTGGILQRAGGWFVKAIGDAGLAAFPESRITGGIQAFLDLKREGDAWLGQQGYQTETQLRLNVGPVALGLIGAPDDEKLDLYGETVNRAATLKGGMVLGTPALKDRLPKTLGARLTLPEPAGALPPDRRRTG